MQKLPNSQPTATEPRPGYFFWFYLIATAIPVVIVVTGLMAPQLYGLNSIDEYWPLMDRTMQEAGIESRGAALIPFVRVSVINPIFWTANVFAAAPTIAGIFMTWFYFRRQGLRTLLDRLRPWRAGVASAVGWRIWGTMMILLAGMKLSEFAIYKFAGLDPQWIWGVNLFSVGFVWFYLSALFLDQGGLLEETGWRGYALPLLQRAMKSPLSAALFLGVFWALWHLPRELANAYASTDEFLVSQFGFLLVSVLLTILISYFFNKTGGSTLIAIAVHGLSNDSVGLGGANFEGPAWVIEGCRAIPYLAGAAIVLCLSGPSLGAPKPKPKDEAP